MSLTDVTKSLSVRAFLFDDDTDSVEVLTRLLNEQGVFQSAIRGLRSLSSSALQAVNHEIATVADGFLKLDLGDILISGWRKYTDLTKAAERTLANPDNEELVVLATHRVISTHHPSVDLLVDGVKVHTFVFEVTVILDLKGVTAVVRRGDLVALRCGECEVTVTLTLEDTPLELSRKSRIDLALIVPLRWPVPLARLSQQPRTSHFNRSTPSISFG